MSLVNLNAQPPAPSRDTLSGTQISRCGVLLLYLAILSLAGQPCAAQGLLQSADGKSSFFNSQFGGMLSVNFSDKSVQLGGTVRRGVAPNWFIFSGIRFKATASDGFASIYETEDGITFPEGELGATVGVSRTFSAGVLSRVDVGIDIAYLRGSFKLFDLGPPLVRPDTGFAGGRLTAAINTQLASLGSVLDVYTGFASGVGSANNHKYLKASQYCETVATGPDNRVETCQPVRSLSEYESSSAAWEASADAYLWFPATASALGVGLGLDFFWRYVEIRPTDSTLHGVALVLSKPGEPQIGLGNLSLQRIQNEWRLGFQASINF